MDAYGYNGETEKMEESRRFTVTGRMFGGSSIVGYRLKQNGMGVTCKDRIVSLEEFTMYVDNHDVNNVIRTSTGFSGIHGFELKRVPKIDIYDIGIKLSGLILAQSLRYDEQYEDRGALKFKIVGFLFTKRSKDNKEQEIGIAVKEVVDKLAELVEDNELRCSILREINRIHMEFERDPRELKEEFERTGKFIRIEYQINNSVDKSMTVDMKSWGRFNSQALVKELKAAKSEIDNAYWTLTKVLTVENGERAVAVEVMNTDKVKSHRIENVDIKPGGVIRIPTKGLWERYDEDTCGHGVIGLWKYENEQTEAKSIRMAGRTTRINITCKSPNGKTVVKPEYTYGYTMNGNKNYDILKDIEEINSGIKEAEKAENRVNVEKVKTGSQGLKGLMKMFSRK